MGLRVLNADGKEVTPIMGSYGIGIERILCAADRAVSRQGRHDPAAVDRALPGGGHAGEQCRRRRRRTRRGRSTRTASPLGLDALLDDRDERPGVKFKDADLIGIPFRIVIGKKLGSGMVELVERKTRQSTDVAVADAARIVQERLKSAG